MTTSVADRRSELRSTMMILLGVSHLILSSYHTGWLLLGSSVNTLRNGI
jgi:hypothetical protein